MMEQGYGQLIAGVAISDSTRRFDRNGTAMPAPAYRKATASLYLEYGWRDWLTLVAAPTFARADATAANAVTGSDGSAFGGRARLWSSATSVVSLQALVQPPLGGDRGAVLASGGARGFAADIRLQGGRAFTLFGMPAFAEVAPGVRLRAAPFPHEARLDLAFGVRPIPPLLLLMQAFAAAAPSRGPEVARSRYAKLQASVVYDLSARWSVQAGLFRTIAGLDAPRETGPLVALWTRF